MILKIVLKDTIYQKKALKIYTVTMMIYLLKLKKNMQKLELEIVEAIKIKYFSHFCEGVIPSRAQVQSKIATRDMRLGSNVKMV